MGKLEIETLENTPMFNGCKIINDSIHEAFCLAIHEGDKNALEWLMANIKDIRLIE